MTNLKTVTVCQNQNDAQIVLMALYLRGLAQYFHTAMPEAEPPKRLYSGISDEAENAGGVSVDQDHRGVQLVAARRRKRVFKIKKNHRAAVKILIELPPDVTMTEAASRIGVNRTTLWRWFQHPEFVTYYHRCVGCSIARSSREWKTNIGRDYRRINQILSGPDQWKANRLANMLVRLYEAADQDRSIAEINGVWLQLRCFLRA